MDFTLSNLNMYISASTIISYLLIGIIKNDLPLIGKWEGVIHLKREKAIMASIVILIISSPIFYVINNFNAFVFLLSFTIGLPIAIIIYSFIIKFRKIKFKKNNSLNLFIYSIFVLILLSIISFFVIILYSTIFNISPPFEPLFLLIFPLIFGFIFLAVAIKSKPVYYNKYVFIGMAKKNDEKKIKNILQNNQIDYILETFKNKKGNNNSNNLIKVLINEKQEYIATSLLENMIDNSPMLKWY